MTRWRRTRLLLGGLALLSLGLVGCGQSDSDVAAAQRAQAALDAGNELKRQLLDAENTLVARCMARKGFPPYDEGAASGRARPSVESPTVEIAQILGYGLDPRRSEVKNEPPMTTSWNALPASEKRRYTLAKFGDMDHDVVYYDFGEGKISSPHGGCLGETRIAIYGDLHEHLRLNWIVANELKQLSSQYLRNDERLAAAIAQWSNCMKDDGFRELADPAAARTAARRGYDKISLEDTAALDRARDEELAIAVADATCADLTGLRTTSRDVRAEAATDTLARHEVQIVAWREFMSKALNRAQELLAQG